MPLPLPQTPPIFNDSFVAFSSEPWSGKVRMRLPSAILKVASSFESINNTPAPHAVDDAFFSGKNHPLSTLSSPPRSSLAVDNAAMNSNATVTYQSIQAVHIEKWLAMSQARRDQLGRAGFAAQEGLHPNTWQNQVHSDGRAKSLGQAKLNKQLGTQYQPIQATHIEKWLAMSQAGRDQLGRIGFAAQEGLHPHTWQRQVHPDGRVKPLGQAKLNKPVGIKYQSITAVHIKKWMAMSQAGRDQLGRAGFAVQEGLHPHTWQQQVHLDGRVKLLGQVKLNKPAGIKYQPITAVHIKKWMTMSQVERNQLGRAGFAKQESVYPQILKHYVLLNGNPRPLGQAKLNKLAAIKYQPICAAHIEKWMRMSQAERDQLGRTGFAEQEGIHPQTWQQYMQLNGKAKSKGKTKLNKQTRIADASIATDDGTSDLASDLTQVDAVTDIDVEETKPDIGPLTETQIAANNDLPILRAPADSKKSLTKEVELDALIGRDIGVTDYRDLSAELQALPTQSQIAIKKKIIAEVRDWINTEGHHQERFCKFLEARVVVDNGPARGYSVFAARDIKKYEVLGPYSGTLLDSSTSFSRERRKYGEARLYAYQWTTRSSQRSVSGVANGNILSLMNTGKLPGQARFKENNVGEIRVGKNMTFYVAMEDIQKNSELFVDYGQGYNPSGLPIKEEN